MFYNCFHAPTAMLIFWGFILASSSNFHTLENSTSKGTEMKLHIYICYISNVTKDSRGKDMKDWKTMNHMKHNEIVNASKFQNIIILPYYALTLLVLFQTLLESLTHFKQDAYDFCLLSS